MGEHKDPNHQRYWTTNPEAERIKRLVRSGRSPVVSLGRLPGAGQIHFDPHNPPDDKDRERYTPWLFISATSDDQGERPLPSPLNRVPLWKTPGIWVETYEPAGTAGQRVDPVLPGQQYQIAAQINNAGYASSYGTIVEFYWWMNPTDTVNSNNFIQIGSPVAITIPAGASAVARSDLWIPALINDQIPDLVVRAYDPVFDPLDATVFSMVKDRHVGWKLWRSPR